MMGDWTDGDWLLLIEDGGYDSMGRVLGYLVFATQTEADAVTRGAACEACNLFKGQPIPDDVTLETIQYGDFKASYGNRMPLANRGRL